MVVGNGGLTRQSLTDGQWINSLKTKEKAVTILVNRNTKSTDRKCLIYFFASHYLFVGKLQIEQRQTIC